ncbi:carbamate kinase [bacterium]|nr:carbamate kinase [bacterium]
MKKLLIALGGNAIVGPGERGTLEEQFQHTDETMTELAQLIKEDMIESFILTHGNGPQVGNIITRSEYCTKILYPLTVDVCVSDSQGGMGYMIQQSLRNCLNRQGLDAPIATIVTQVLVDPDDPAMKNPTKYIGSFMTEEDAKKKHEEEGWIVKEDPGRGWRRVIASPEPKAIIELNSIRKLYDAGATVIACGGGGIPVVRKGTDLHGVDGVIDKDLASALLANELGIETFLIMTGADGIYTNYKKPDEKHHPKLYVSELLALVAEGHFPAGSMGPKVKAALKFIERGGKRVIITTPGNLAAALRGEAGSEILPD